MKIIHKQVSDLNAVEYRACYLANYRADGYMQPELERCRNGGRQGQVIMLWDGPDDDIKSLIGWALLTPVRRWGLLEVTRHAAARSKFTAQFWVKSQYRKHGHGKTLMNEVKKLDPRPHVIPHDRASSELFSQFEVQVLNEDKHWIRSKPKVS